MTTGSHDKEAYYRTLLDAMPIPILLVDADVNIIDLNAAASEMLKTSQVNILGKKQGEAMHCIHAAGAAGGCGKGPQCKSCTIRESVGEAIQGKQVKRRLMKAELISGQSVQQVEFLVTTTAVPIEDETLVLLILEDIGEISRLRSLVPMCSNCKRIRNDEQYWQRVEVYFREFLGLNVTHGLCQDCVRELYPEHSDHILKEERKTKEDNKTKGFN